MEKSRSDSERVGYLCMMRVEARTRVIAPSEGSGGQAEALLDWARRFEVKSGGGVVPGDDGLS